MKYITFLSTLILTGTFFSHAQSPAERRARAEETELWVPVPKVVVPGKNFNEPPSDATVLFDGENLDQWETASDKSPAKWNVSNGVVTIDTRSGSIQTKKTFMNFQLHIEWLVPKTVDGEGQARGNSGVFLAATKGNAGGYEIQVLDGYNNENKTYVNGMVGSVYKEGIPLANPSKKAGEWNVYDIAWKAPIFDKDGKIVNPAKVTVFLNGVLVQNNYELKGESSFIGKHEYMKQGHGPSPIKLQAHRNEISFRNIWVREE